MHGQLVDWLNNHAGIMAQAQFATSGLARLVREFEGTDERVHHEQYPEFQYATGK